MADFSPRRMFPRFVAIAALVILLPQLLQPFSLDNNIHQTQGWILSEFGRLPYLGSWDQNFPGIVYVHAAIISLFGVSPTAFRVVDVLLHLTGVMLVASIVARSHGERTGGIAALLYAMIYMLAGFWMAGQRDGLAGILILGSVRLYLFLHDRRESISIGHGMLGMLAGGVLMGFAISFRPTLGLLAVTLGIVILIYEKRNRVAWLAAYFVGGLLPWIAILLPYLAIPGALDEFYTAVVRFNMEIYAQPMFRRSILRPHELFCDLILLLWIATRLRMEGVEWLRGRSRALRSMPLETFLFATFYIAAKIGVVVMGKYYIQHYDGLLILSEILLAVSITRLIGERWESRLVRKGAMAMLAVVTCLIYARSYVPGLIRNLATGQGASLRVLHAHLPLWCIDRTDVDEALLADFLEARNVRRGDAFEFIGLQPGIYWKSGTRSASRFTMVSPLVFNNPTGRFTGQQRSWQKELVDSLRSVGPSYIAFDRNGIAYENYVNLTGAGLIDTIAGLRRFLDEAYERDTVILNWEVYRREEGIKN
jgi:hypothetical protein